MKTTIEVNGYEIVIEETDGMVSVSALKDGETVEEFSLEATEGAEGVEGEEVQSFGEYEEEEDFEGEVMPGEDTDLEDELEEEEEDEMPEEEDELEEEEDELEEEEEQNAAPALESFSSFINKKSNSNSKKTPKKNSNSKVVKKK